MILHFVWTVMTAPDGTLWAGSGNEGQVLKIGKDGKLSTFFDAPELEVHALAPADYDDARLFRLR